VWTSEVEAHLPKEILLCRSVARELVFRSYHAIEHLWLEQRMLLDGVEVESESSGGFRACSTSSACAQSLCTTLAL
jgi:hypothetical protein